jgi:hypothetical protein
MLVAVCAIMNGWKRPLDTAWSLALLAYAQGCTASTSADEPRDGGPPPSADATSADGALDGSPPAEGAADAPPDHGAGEGGTACAASPQIYGDLKPLWSMTLGSGYFAGVGTDSAGDIVVAGSALGSIAVGSQTFLLPGSGGSNAPFVLKLDASGGLLWHREFSGQGNVDAMAVDSSGNIYIAGDIGAFATSPLDLGKGVLQGSFFLAKLDAAGSTLWTYSAQPFQNGNTSESANVSITVDPSGDVAVVGDALVPTAFGGQPPGDASVGDDQGFIAVFDPMGKPKYSKVYGADSPGATARFDSSGNLLVAGQFTGHLDLSSPLTAPNGTTAFAAKVDSTGKVSWQRADGTYSVASAVATNAAGAVIAGTFGGTIGLTQPTSAKGPADVFLAGLDESGMPTFEKTIPAAGLSIDALASDPTGGVVAAGRLGAYANLGGGLLAPPGLVIAKFDAAGNHVYSARFAVAPYTSLSAGRPTLAVDTGGNVVLASSFYGAADLGTGIVSGVDPGSPSLFVARYAPQAPHLSAPRAACPIPPTDAGLPEGGRLVATAVDVTPDMALSADAVYWTTGTEVMRVPLAGGDALPVAIAQNGANALGIDSRSIYWTNKGGPTATGSVVALALDGGTVTTLASGQDSPGAVAVADAGVYFVVGGTYLADGGRSPASVLSVPLAGGTPATVVSGLGPIGPVATNGDVVAFVVSSVAGTVSQISTAPSVGGATTVLATSNHFVPAIAVDATTVYWADASSSGIDTTSADGAIRSVPLAGGPATVLAQNQAAPAKTIVLGSTLYWSAAGTFSNVTSSGNGGLWSIPASGGTPTGLVTNRLGVRAFSVSASHLAWFDLLDPAPDLLGLFVIDR